MDNTSKNNQSPGGQESLPSSGLGRCRLCEHRYESLCGVLDCEELDRLDQVMTWVHYPPGKLIFMEGDKTDNYFNVSDGVVRAVKLMPDGRRTILDFLFKGDFLGLSNNGKYPFSAEAITPVKLCRFPRPRLQELFEEIPKMETRLLGIFGEKLAQAHSQIIDLGRKSPREKLATFLLWLSKKKTLTGEDNTFYLPMSREDISDYLGLTVESISRTFSKFTREGLIEIENRKKIKLLDIEALEVLAESL